jgi:hypothetical protein
MGSPRAIRRRLLPLLVALGLVAMAAVALAQVGGPPKARAAAISSSGAFETSNSAAGGPIFAATGIAPGGSTSGTVTIKDEGSEEIGLKLHRGELVDTPGSGGGVLSGRLILAVVDVTKAGAPRVLYDGPLDSMPDVDAGNLGAGDSRTYEFTATLPDEGSSTFQNEAQGASTTVAYTWNAGEAEEGGGEEEGEEGGSEEGGGGDSGGGGGTAGGGGNPGPGPSPGGSESGGKGAPVDTLNLTVPKARRMVRGGRFVVWTTCDKACRVSVRGRIRATVAGTHRGARIRFTTKRVHPAGAQRLRIPIPRKLRRWIRETPGKAHLRAKLRFLAISPEGERDAVRKTLRLRTRRHLGAPYSAATGPEWRRG